MKQKEERTRRKTLAALAAIRGFLPADQQNKPLTRELMKSALHHVYKACTAQIRRRGIRDRSLSDDACQLIVFRMIARRILKRRFNPVKGTLRQFMAGVRALATNDVLKGRLIKPLTSVSARKEIELPSASESAIHSEHAMATRYCFHHLSLPDQQALCLRYPGLYGSLPSTETRQNADYCRAARAERTLRSLIGRYWTLRRLGLPLDWLKIV